MLYVLNKTNFDIFKDYYSNSECIIDNMMKITTFLATVYIYSYYQSPLRSEYILLPIPRLLCTFTLD